jgi:regulator of sigma E protease
VRVETFSIGFGPKIFKYKKGDTEYAISIIPLGGYVKMFGDDPFNKEAIPEEEQKFSYNHKGKWARFWIVLGGPLTNFILAFFIFYSLFLVGEKIPEIKLGAVSAKSTLYSYGVRSGDVLTKVNENDVYNPSDLVGDSNTPINSVEVRRHGEYVKLKVNLKGEKFFDEVMKHPPFLRKPFVVDANGKIFALALKEKNVDLTVSLEEIIDSQSKRTIYLYPLKDGQNLNSEKLDFELDKEQVKTLEFNDLETFASSLRKNDLWTMDLMVKSMNFNSPAEKAGILGGDIFTKINETQVSSFENLRDTLQKVTTKEVSIELIRKGEKKIIKLSPDEQTIDGKKMKLIGVYSYIEIQPVQFIKTKSKGIFGSAYFGLFRTWDSVKKTFDGFFKIITNQVSFKSVGGVFTIGKVANDSFKISFTYFLQIMALISVNLGIINLFPMLPLDGGHIMFLFLELINGGPISRRKMEIAQQIGLSLLLMLMVGSIFNDVTRFF